MRLHPDLGAKLAGGKCSRSPFLASRSARGNWRHINQDDGVQLLNPDHGYGDCGDSTWSVTYDSNEFGTIVAAPRL